MIQLTFLIVSILASVAEARQCYIDSYGRRRCTSTLSTGIRAAIGVAIAVAVLLLLSACLFMRRRRTRRANLAYIGQPQGTDKPQQAPYPPQPNQGPHPPQNTGHPQQDAGYSPNGNGAPQFPAPTGDASNYASPTMPPPVHQGYAPPQGAPPPGTTSV